MSTQVRSRQPVGFWPQHGWLFGLATFAVCIVVGFIIGFSAGTPEKAKKAEKPAPEVAKLTTKATQPTGSKLAVSSPPTEPKTVAAVPTRPEPKATPMSPPTRPEPKKVEPKKVETKKEPEPKPAAKTDAPTFEKIGAIFKAKCTVCHGEVGVPKGGLDLRTLASLNKGGDSGTAVKPGDPTNSPLWDSIDTGQMPPPNKEQLTAEEKKLIREWIAGGAK